MKSFALISLIPFVLAYGGKPRKALPRTVPLDDDYESPSFESFWDHYSAKPEKELERGTLGNDFGEIDNEISSDGFDHDDLQVFHGGKLRKALPKSYPVHDELVLPEIGSLFESETFEGFKPPRDVPQTARFLNGGDELADSTLFSAEDLELEDDYDRSLLQVTVPVAHSHGSRFKAFPKQEIMYQMGTKVLTDEVSIYIIYYGKWQPNQKDLLNNFTSSLGDSSWWNIMRKYYYQQDQNSTKVYVSGKLKLANTVDDMYSMGRRLVRDAIPNLINTHVKKGNLPKDSAGIYLVLTSDDVQEEYRLGGAKMCRDYCGYHLTGNFPDGNLFYYAMAGRPTKCILNCGGPNARSSPNGDPATDSMASVIAHELAETVSDPNDEFKETRAWNDVQFMENGDMCAYKFGEIKRLTGDGKISFYNYESASGNKFLVQQNWDPELQKCVSSA